MSRVGKLPVRLPQGVSVATEGDTITVKGPKGQLQRRLPPLVGLNIEAGSVQVERRGEGRRARAMHGLCRAVLQNLVTGVSQGFTRVLELNGVGYRAEAKQGVLSLALGHSHPIEVLLPKGVTAQVERNLITLSGIDRDQLGQLAASIRDQRPPEPYKGKGLKYREETIRRKVGKTGTA